MNRFLKVLALLVVSLFVLVSGVDVTLDHMSHAATQSAFTCYNQKGQVILAYNGDLALSAAYAKPQPVAPAAMLRRANFASPTVD